MSEEQTTFVLYTSDYEWLASFALVLAFHIDPVTGNLTEREQSNVSMYRNIPIDSHLEYEGYHMRAMIQAHPQSVPIGHIWFQRYDTSTLVTIQPMNGAARFWMTLKNKLEELVSAHYQVHRSTLTQEFEQILDRYYEMRRTGDNPKLAKLARETGVKYGSLRQYKIRYDEAHGYKPGKEIVSPDAQNKENC